MAPGQTGFDSYGHEKGNIDMNMSEEDILLAQQQSQKPIPYAKRGRRFGRGGLLARGGAVKSSNVLGKGGTPKAKRGGSIGRNGIL
jgi:hypothetical protein